MPWGPWMRKPGDMTLKEIKELEKEVKQMMGITKKPPCPYDLDGKLKPGRKG